MSHQWLTGSHTLKTTEEQIVDVCAARPLLIYHRRRRHHHYRCSLLDDCSGGASRVAVSMIALQTPVQQHTAVAAAVSDWLFVLV